MYGYSMGPPVVQTPGMDSVMDSKELREDGYTTEDDINLNTFFNEGPDLKIVEIEQKIYVENGVYVDHIENNNQEDTQVNPVRVFPDQQVQKDVLKWHISILTNIYIFVAADPTTNRQSGIIRNKIYSGERGQGNPNKVLNNLFLNIFGMYYN